MFFWCNRNLIVFTIFRFVLNQMEYRLVQNKSKNSKDNLSGKKPVTTCTQEKNLSRICFLFMGKNVSRGHILSWHKRYIYTYICIYITSQEVVIYNDLCVNCWNKSIFFFSYIFWLTLGTKSIEIVYL